MSIAMDSKVNIVPNMRYADVAAAIDWLCEASCFERHMVVPGENGTIDPEDNVWTFGTHDPNAENEESA